MFAQPLLVTNYEMPNGALHDVLVIATGNNSVYAFDAHSYKLLYKVNLGKQQASVDVDCDDVMPGYGITGTPMIVREGERATIYLVSATEPRPNEFHHRLHALDLGTGKDMRAPAEIAPSARFTDGTTNMFDPRNQWSRTGVAVSGKSLYFGVSSHCDNKSTAVTGWILRYGLDLKPEGAFNTIGSPGEELASVWMTGFAPAIDARGDVWVATGNGPYGPAGHDYGESILRFTPTLKVGGSFTPHNWLQMNDHDLDQGSGGVVLLPRLAGQTGPDRAAQVGKTGILYLLDQASPGGISPTTDKVLAKINVGGGVWGGPAYFDGANGPTLIEQGDMDKLHSYLVPPNATRFVAKASGTTQAGYGGSTPIVSSNGNRPDTGVVWVVRRSAPIELEAYNAETLGAPIYRATIGPWSNPMQGNAFLTAMEANGRVYVGANKVVKVFGLTK